MLLSKGKITGVLVDNPLSWPHSGFHVHQSLPWTLSRGERIESDDKEEMVYDYSFFDSLVS